MMTTRRGKREPRRVQGPTRKHVLISEMIFPAEYIVANGMGSPMQCTAALNRAKEQSARACVGLALNLLSLASARPPALGLRG